MPSRAPSATRSSRPDVDLLEMRVERPHAAAVCDDDRVAEAAQRRRPTTRPARAAVTGVPAGAMKSRPAWNESPLGPKPSRALRRRARLRRAGSWTAPTQAAMCPRPRDADRGRSREALEAAHRGLQAWAEGAVERPRGKAVPGEPELELRDVPAACADGQRAGAELRPAEISESAARARARRCRRARAPRAAGRRAAPRSVSGPRQPSTGPTYASAARSATCSAATSASPAPAGRPDAGSRQSAQIVPTDAARKRTYPVYSAQEADHPDCSLFVRVCGGPLGGRNAAIPGEGHTR